jgi:hypothetical protein
MMGINIVSAQAAPLASLVTRPRKRLGAPESSRVAVGSALQRHNT